MRRTSGFTLVELMVVVVVIGILAAVAIPNFSAMQSRAKEAGVRANMHTFQLSAEDYAVQNVGFYPVDASIVVGLMPGGDGSFRNSFSGLTGTGVAWEDRTTFGAPASQISGITSYADSGGTTYNVKGYGKTTPISVTLSSGY